MNAPADWPQSLKVGVGEAFRAGVLRRPKPLLSEIANLPDDQRGRAFRLAILRSFTVETASDFIALALACVPLRAEVRLGPLDVIVQELGDAASATCAWRPNAILVLWRLEELDPALCSEGQGWTGAARIAAGNAIIDRVRALAQANAARAPVFLSTLPQIEEQPGDLADHADPDGVCATRTRINQYIRETCASTAGFYVFDFAGWAENAGAAAFDRRLELFARQPLAGPAIPAFALAIARALTPLVRPRAKVLALDLDHTLWAGILGEDGLAGVQCGQDYPGSAHRAIQRCALALRGQGVLLVLLSKNNPEEVEVALDTHPDLLLRRPHFAAIRANWRPKHENLAEVAAELGVGTDSFVFLDDQAFERDKMRFYAPEVRVLEMEGEPYEMLAALRSSQAFDVLALGAEDRNRADDYAHRSGRQAPTGDPTDFLRSLGLRAAFSHVSEGNLARVVQLLGKTNQFNVATRRHGEADVRALLSAGGFGLTAALSDRFGDQGLVAIILAVPQETTLRIDIFLMSCRVLGRGLEQAMWSELVRMASERGFTLLEAEYLRTAKNDLAADLFTTLGMVETSRTADRHGYSLVLPASATFPDWIELTKS